jgi:hypothetical protein
MQHEHDPERLAEEVEEELKELDERGEDLGKKAIEVRRDWEAKRNDPNVPGTPAPDREADAERGEGDPD